MTNAPTRPDDHRGERVLIVACGALTREIRAVLAQIPGAGENIDVRYLPAALHNRPEQIPARVDDVLSDIAGRYHRVVVAYADCGTGGRLDALLRERNVERLPGAHCYGFFAGNDEFAALHDEEPGTFYLTDFLARQFEQLVIVGLGLDRHPELRDQYFGNYRRLVLLSQSDDPALVEFGRAAAARLGLAFVHRHVGIRSFEVSMRQLLSLPVAD